MVLRSIVRLALAALLTTAASSSALAAPLFTITITPDPVTGSVGQTVNLDYELVNVSGSYVVLTGVNDNSVPTVGFDGTFFEGLFAYLAPGATSSGFLGTFEFLPGTPSSGTVDLDFTFVYAPADLTDDDLLAFDPLQYDADVDQASFRFRTTQTPPVPEPTSLALVGLGLAGALGARVRRRRA